MSSGTTLPLPAERADPVSAGHDPVAFARLAARSGHPVLLLGETGSGKTRLARLIHDSGPRARRPFVRVNCSSIPDTLFEREMFGHVRGAFTDAREAGHGFLTAADGGTLFLDEVSELPLSMQPKLLSFLEDGTFRRLGSPTELRVDVQVVAATNRDPGGMVREGLFRRDLYYRFSVLPFHVPALRERPGEIAQIARELLRRNVPPGEPVPELAPDALEAIRAHAWPGNVRELENALRGALLFLDGAAIEARHLPAEVLEAVEGGADGSRARYEAPADPQDEVRAIEAAIRLAGGNKTAAARSLGMSRSTLWAKLQRFRD